MYLWTDVCFGFTKGVFSKRILGLLLKIPVHKCDQSFRSKLCFQFTSTESQNGPKMTRKRKIYRLCWHCQLCTGACPLFAISAKWSPAQNACNLSPPSPWLAVVMSSMRYPWLTPSSLWWLHWCCPATVLRMLLTRRRSLAMPVLLIGYAWTVQHIVTTAV